MVPLEGARPDGFLRLATGEPRGFWARGERWVAHAGVVARLAVDDGVDRFRRVRDGARALLRHGDGVEPLTGERFRWYGGFSFTDDHRASGFWSAFPPALFVLPRLELEGDAQGVGRLRLRAPVDTGDDLVAVRARLEVDLREIRSRLADEGRPAGGARGEAGAVERRETDRRLWEEAVREALVEIGAGRISKVVLARTLDATSEGALDAVDVVEALQGENRGTHVYLFEPVPGQALVGAAPETIATLRRGVFHCTAVAGSTRRGDTPDETNRLARELLASGKDRSEQRMVVEDVVARLTPLVDSIRAQEEPHVLSLARIQHLETGIRARITPERHVLDLVEALHPTPAVCGLPRDGALGFLRAEEPFERGWYAGPVGWFDRDGNGVFAPALRSAVTRGRSWRLFAGAGIVRGSRPDAEWEETRIKFEPVLRALDAVARGRAATDGASEDAAPGGAGPDITMDSP